MRGLTPPLSFHSLLFLFPPQRIFFSPARSLSSAPDPNSRERPSLEMDYRSPHRSHLVLSPGLPATGPSPLHQTHNCVTSLLKHREQLPTALLTPAIGTLRERTRGTRTVQAFPSLFLAITVILEESYYSVIIITPNIIPTLHLVTSVLSASFPEPPTN